VRDGRLRTNIGNVSALDDAVATFNATERRAGKTVIRAFPADKKARAVQGPQGGRCQ